MSATATSFDFWALLRAAKVVPQTRGETDLDLAKAVERGLPIRILTAMLARGVLESNDVSLVLPVRTYQDRKAKRARLSPDESDRVARLARVTELAADCLGDLERGKAWLRTRNPALRGERPLDWVRTSDGTRVVEQLLQRIDYGIGF